MIDATAMQSTKGEPLVVSAAVVAGRLRFLGGPSSGHKGHVLRKGAETIDDLLSAIEGLTLVIERMDKRHSERMDAARSKYKELQARLKAAESRDAVSV